MYFAPFPLIRFYSHPSANRKAILFGHTMHAMNLIELEVKHSTFDYLALNIFYGFVIDAKHVDAELIMHKSLLSECWKCAAVDSALP